MAIQNATNRWAVAQWIVNKTAGLGTHTTIQSAINDASANDSIAIMEGTYTENLNVTKNLSFFALNAGERVSAAIDVVVSGQITISASTSASFNGINFSTNGASICSLANNISLVEFTSCSFTVETGVPGFEISGTSSNIYLFKCSALGTGTATLFNVSGSDSVFWYLYSICLNFTTTSTVSAGNVRFKYSDIFSCPITASGSAAAYLSWCSFGTEIAPYLNSTWLTTSGTGTSQVSNCRLYSGTASAISIGAGTTVECINSTIYSTNTNAITGAGTLKYALLSFSGSSSTINVTTQSQYYGGPTAKIGSSNSAGTNTFTVENTSNTASSEATIACTTAGATAGDAKYTASTTTTTWGWGVDNSATTPSVDPFVISSGGALGTTNIMEVATTGEINFPLQSAFLADAANQLSVTGDGTTYTVLFANETFDQNGDYDSSTSIFTAPVTGKYFFGCYLEMNNYTSSHTTGYFDLVTSGGSYRLSVNAAYNVQAATGYTGIFGSVIVPMTAADTAYIDVTVSNGTKVVSVRTNSKFFGQKVD